MAASAIPISLDSSYESMGSSPSRVILFEYITPLPATSPFLYTDSPDAFDSSDGPPSQDPYAITVSRWRRRVTTHSSSPSDFPIAPVTAPPGTRRRATILIRPREAFFFRLAWRRVSPRSLDHHPSSSSSPTNYSQVHSLGLDAPGDSSERPLYSSSYFSGPSRKRCTSPADFVPSSTLVTGSLVPTRADLLPPHKRYRHSYSYETSMEEDTEIDTIETEDSRELDILDGDDVRDRIKIDPRDDREEFEARAGDMVVLGFDLRLVPMVDEGIVEPVEGDSSSSSGTRDGTVKSVEDIPVDLDGAIRDFYHYMSELRMDRIVRIETTQRQTMTNTRSRMIPATIKEIINRRVAEALEPHEINKNLGPENGNGNGNGNGGNGNGNGGNGNGQGGNRNGDGRGDRPVVRECTYQDFMNCQPLNFKGTKGVVGLIRWYEKIETVFHISNCLERYQVKYATCTLLNGALTWWNSHKRTIGTDAAYTLSWRKLKKLMI
uniref:Reverse transcriptase domain-containing protein n=1 Tax=Tanacetum cinerariifolium TaxID=118510 RepID=A0A6L2L7C6_TANCI|nr:reverse transcriptase domain-containing protein [Tanacetum cinerariifolium]